MTDLRSLACCAGPRTRPSPSPPSATRPQASPWHHPARHSTNWCSSSLLPLLLPVAARRREAARRRPRRLRRRSSAAAVFGPLRRVARAFKAALEARSCPPTAPPAGATVVKKVCVRRAPFRSFACAGVVPACGTALLAPSASQRYAGSVEARRRSQIVYHPLSPAHKTQKPRPRRR